MDDQGIAMNNGFVFGHLVTYRISPSPRFKN
jgi:hypothetical protein